MSHVFQVNENLRKVTPAESRIAQINAQATLEQEIDAMVLALREQDPDRPDIVLTLTMALMARCTEIYLTMVRIEADHPKAKAFRTMQLQKVMDLIEFCSRGASRLIEVRRQDIDLSR